MIDAAHEIIADAASAPHNDVIQRALLKRAASCLRRMSEKDGLAGVEHPLGFSCITLANTPEASVRLHVWPSLPGGLRPTGPVHDHIWHLASMVLLGQITNRFFQAVPDETSKGRLYAVEYNGMRNRFLPCGGRHRIDEVLPRQIYYPGDAYAFPAGVLHDSIVPDNTMTASLLVAAQSGRRQPFVYLERPGTEMTRLVLDENQCRSLIEIVAMRIEQSVS